MKKLIDLNQDAVSISDLNIIFPLGLRFSDVDVKVSKKVGFYASKVEIIPSLLLPFTFPFGNASFKILVKSSGSDFKVITELDRKEQGFSIETLEAEGVLDLSNIRAESHFRGRGEINFNLSLYAIDSLDRSHGKIRIFSNRLTLEVSGLQMFEGEITLGETELIGNIENGVLNIFKLQSKGGDIEASITGKIKLGRNLNESELDLVVDAKTKLIDLPAQKFKIEGSINHPKISSM